jgi:Rad3-related DNA helicase
MVSKALKIQHEKEDDEHETNMSKLQDEVAKLQNSLEEKESEITSLKENLAETKKEKEQAEKTHNDGMVKMKEQYDSMNDLRTSLEKEKENILAKDKENQNCCFEITLKCCDSLKRIFSSIGTTSRNSSYASGDTEGALTWAEKELGEIEAVINARSNYSAMIGSRGMTSVLEKAGCQRIKKIGKTNLNITMEDINMPSKDVPNDVKRFFFEVWKKGGRQLAASEAMTYTKKVCL